MVLSLLTCIQILTRDRFGVVEVARAGVFGFMYLGCKIVLDKLGEGAYSSVYKVCRKADRQEYALKKVKISNLSEKEKENALNEVRLLASVNHPNIIAYREAFLDEPSNSLCIVMEYADDGDVFQLISAHKKKKEYIPEERVWSITAQVVRGLRELHRLKILHRDMKSANIFLTKDGRAKLGDMNVSKIAKKGLLYTQTGTPYYASPEVWREKPYNHKSDIWSLGCVIFQMCSLKPPFRAEDMEGLYKKVIKGSLSKIPGCFSKQLFDLIREMLTVNPENRPSCEQLLANPALGLRSQEEQDTACHSVMISTIKVPNNLYYLTDVLPRPNYNPSDKKRNETLPDNDRRLLPSLPKLKNPKREPKLPKEGKEGKARIPEEGTQRLEESEKIEREQTNPRVRERERERERQRQYQLERLRYERQRQKLLKNREEYLRDKKKRMKEGMQRKKLEIQAIYGRRNDLLQVQGHRMREDDKRAGLLLPKIRP